MKRRQAFGSSSQNERLQLWRNRRSSVLAMSADKDATDHMSDMLSSISYSAKETLSDISQTASNDSSIPRYQNENHSENDLSSVDSSSEFISETDTSSIEGVIDIMNDLSLRSSLKSWALNSGCTRDCINNLLHILIETGHSLPKDSRTLLGTPQDLTSIPMNDGEYVYFGVKQVAEKLFALESDITEIKLRINIDGLPLYKSSTYQLWPILIMFNNSLPETIGLYGGKKKPVMEEFLKEFVNELLELLQGPVLINGKAYTFSIQMFTCDAPARAMLKGIVQHTGYYSCERCTAKGVWFSHRLTFPHLTGIVRTDEEFRANSYSVPDRDGRSHQNGVSVLLPLPFNMIKDVNLDFMHLVCLGVTRRILYYCKGSFKGIFNGRLPANQLNLLSQKLVSLNVYHPSEFNRTSRSLAELDRWKATELRTFLLYTGLVVLKGILNERCYKHFLSLSIAIRILCSNENLRNNYIDAARQLLTYFVSNAKEHYGKTFCVYNVHGLLHIADDVVNFRSSLDDISAFPFENYLQTIKRLVRSRHNPVAQIAKRLKELEGTIKKVNNRDIKISTKEKDRIFLTTDGVFMVERIQRGYYYGKLYRKCSLKNFFADFIESSLLDIYYIEARVKPLQTKKGRNSLTKKCFSIPYKNGFVVVPLL